MLLLFLMLAAVPATPCYSHDSWVVLENDENCILVGDYGDESRLWVTYNFGLNESKFIYTDKAFKSADDSKSYSIKLSFVKSGRLDNGWGNVAAKGIKLGDVGGVTFFLKSQDALVDLSSSSIFGLSLNDDIIASLSLKGSAPAVEALEVCARKMHQINPSDPLDGAELPTSDRK